MVSSGEGIRYEGQNLQIAMKVFWNVVGRGCKEGDVVREVQFPTNRF